MTALNRIHCPDCGGVMHKHGLTDKTNKVYRYQCSTCEHTYFPAAANKNLFIVLVVGLNRIYETSDEDIAKTLGISIGMVRNQLKNAEQILGPFPQGLTVVYGLLYFRVANSEIQIPSADIIKRRFNIYRREFAAVFHEILSSRYRADANQSSVEGVTYAHYALWFHCAVFASQCIISASEFEAIHLRVKRFVDDLNEVTDSDDDYLRRLSNSDFNRMFDEFSAKVGADLP